MTGAKPLSFKSRSSQIFMVPRKLNKFQNGTAHRPKWKFGRAGNVLEGMNKHNAKGSKEIKH